MNPKEFVSIMSDCVCDFSEWFESFKNGKEAPENPELKVIG